MKTIVMTLLVLLASSLAWSQEEGLPLNSFEYLYAAIHPDLHYSYDAATQTHNYSGNWDFDGDSIADQLMFVGNGGVHLYFHLRLVLSTDEYVRDYPFISVDMPVLPAAEYASRKEFNPLFMQCPISVLDCNGDKSPDIFIRLDQSAYTVNAALLREHRINSHMLMVTFQKGKVKLQNY